MAVVLVAAVVEPVEAVLAVQRRTGGGRGLRRVTGVHADGRSHPLDRLVPLDPLLLARPQHPLPLDPQPPPLQLVAVERRLRRLGLGRMSKVGKREAAEDAVVVVVVERAGQRQVEVLL